VLDIIAGFLVCITVLARPLLPGLAAEFWHKTFFIVAPVLALVLLQLRRAYDREFVLVRSGPDLPLGVWFVAMCLATALAVYRRPGVEFLVEFFSLATVMVVICNHPQRQALAKTVLGCLVATVVITCVYGFYQREVVWGRINEIVETTPDDQLARILARDFKVMMSPGREMLEAFKARARERDVYSTFLLANTFAGFLVLLLPVLAGVALAGIRKALAARRGWLSASSAVAVVVIAFTALLLTHSGGGILAGLFALAAFAALAATLGRPGRYRVVLWVLVGMVAAAAVFVPAVAGSIPMTHGPLDSLAVRAGFWQGAFRIWRAAPILGRGLGSFSDYYFQVKAPGAFETKMAHGIFFKMLAEGGILCFAAFVWFLGACSFKASRVPEWSDASTDSGGTDVVTASSRGDAGGKVWFWTGVSALVVVVLVLSRVLRVFPWFDSQHPDSALPIWLALAGIVGFALARKLTLASRFVSVGIVAGVLGLVLHGSVDFDLSAPGILAALFALLGCQFALQPDVLAETRKALSAKGAVLLGAVFLAGFFVFSQVVKPLSISNISFNVANMKVQNDIGKAIAVLRNPSAGRDQWALVAAAARGESKPSTAAAPAVEALLDDIENLRDAASSDPRYIEPQLALGDLWRRLLVGALGVRGHSAVSTDILAAAETAYTEALSINPRSGKAGSALVGLYDQTAKAVPGEAGYLDKAIDYARTALELYPTLPAANLALGGLLFRRYRAVGDQTDSQEARKHIKEALRLTTDCVRELHVKLTSEQKKSARDMLRALRRKPAVPAESEDDVGANDDDSVRAPK